MIRQTSVIMDERKFDPRSDNNVLGAPWRARISSTNSCATRGASMEGMAKASGQRVTGVIVGKYDNITVSIICDWKWA